MFHFSSRGRRMRSKSMWIKQRLSRHCWQPSLLLLAWIRGLTPSDTVPASSNTMRPVAMWTQHSMLPFEQWFCQMHMSARLHRIAQYHSRLRWAKESMRTKSMRSWSVLRCRTQSRLLLPRTDCRQSVQRMYCAQPHARRTMSSWRVRWKCRLFCQQQPWIMLLSSGLHRRSLCSLQRASTKRLRTESLRAQCTMHHQRKWTELVPLPWWTWRRSD